VVASGNLEQCIAIHQHGSIGKEDESYIALAHLVGAARRQRHRLHECGDMAMTDEAEHKRILAEAHGHVAFGRTIQRDFAERSQRVEIP
jgi:hypothetical protein